LDRTVRLRTVGIVVGVLVLVAGAFFAGTRYERNRIENEIQQAFGIDDDDAELFDDTTGGADGSEVEGGAEKTTYGDPVPLGEEATWDLGEGDQWSVTLTDFECGLKSIPKAAENPAYYSGDDYDAPEYIDATAPTSQMFCIATSDWVNSGTGPDTLAAYTTMSELVLPDGVEMGASQEDEVATNALGDDEFNQQINPGGSMTVRNVYTMPEGTQVAGVSLKDFEMMSDVRPLLFSVE